MPDFLNAKYRKVIAHLVLNNGLFCHVLDLDSEYQLVPEYYWFVFFIFVEVTQSGTYFLNNLTSTDDN